MALFSIAAILPDTGTPINLDGLFTIGEWDNYWQTQNLRQYMSKSSSPVGRMLPVAIAWPLLSEFIHSADEVIKGKSDTRANFRFAHAETVIPFVALILYLNIGKIMRLLRWLLMYSGFFIMTRL